VTVIQGSPGDRPRSVPVLVQPPPVTGSGATPVLVACGHGTRGAAGRRAMAQLRLDVAALRPGLQVLAASVDVQKPALPAVLAGLAAQGRGCVVVPLLLAAGYHVRVDVAQAVARAGGLAVGSRALGPDPALLDVLEARLNECGAQPDDALVLGAAGSTDPAAVADVQQVAAELSARRGRPVTAGFLAAASPTVEEAVAAARPPGRPVTLATFLLSPGFFADRMATSGADRVSAPMAPHPALAGLVLRRYDEALLAGPRGGAPVGLAARPPT
jgi:sirohydrochlorin ferrochelatase